MSQKNVYVLHGITFMDEKRANVEPFVMAVSHQESVICKLACKTMLEELVAKFGKPQKVERDDDLDDERVFINQQIVQAYEHYQNTDRVDDGPNKGKLKLSWQDRYRRIDAVYEKLRPDAKYHTMTGKYYYITRQPLTVLAKK